MVQDQEKGNAAKRMAEIHETLEKLVAVAKKKGYIDQECTVQSLKDEAAHKRSEDEQGDAVGLMTAMKKSLDTQTQAVCSTSTALCRTRCRERGHSSAGDDARKECNVTFTAWVWRASALIAVPTSQDGSAACD